MATWDKFNYGPEARNWGESWIPATVDGTGGAVIYFHGAGFESGTTEQFYDAAQGEAFFLEQIETREASGSANERTCCFSIKVAEHRYDQTHSGIDAWADGILYAFGAYVSYSGSNYICITGHTSATANDRPSDGTNWTLYWRVSPKNDLGGKRRPTFTTDTPAYGASGLMDALLAYNYIVEHAPQYNFDPTKVVVMGQSAGGQKMSAIIWNLMGSRMPYVDPGAFNPHRLRTAQRPAGAIFRQTWDTLANQPNSVVAAEAWGARLIGRPFTSDEWDDYPDDLKNSISNLGILNMTQDASVPCYFEYVTTGQQHDDGVDNTPPYSTDDAHHPKNGWQIFDAVVDTYGGANCIFVEDHDGSDTTRRYDNSTSTYGTFERTGTNLSADMWTWYESVTGV